MNLRVLLADDHPIVREGLRAVLGAHSDFLVVGEAEAGPAVLPLVEQLKPDVLVLDLMMPGLGGLEITRQVRDAAPQTCVVILSMHANEAYVAEAFRAGARAYILKQSAARELVTGLRTALAGQSFLSAQISQAAVAEYEQMTQPGAIDPFRRLTPREQQVLGLLAEGRTNSQIAAHLHIGQRTVETHRAHLMRKLNLHSIADVARFAMQQGLAGLD
jgi:two-component system, NarL family, response regulator NreC